MRFSYWETMVMNKVLFEVNWFGNIYSFLWIISTVVLLILGLCILVRERHKYNGKLAGVMLAFWIFIVLTTTVHLIIQYNCVVIQYKKGNYMEVEGTVENFSRRPKSGHQRESFTLNGVVFAYDPSATWGYCQPRENGGVIAGNGQHLRIRYIPYYNGDNVIVYIERTRGENE